MYCRLGFAKKKSVETLTASSPEAKKYNPSWYKENLTSSTASQRTRNVPDR